MLSNFYLKYGKRLFDITFSIFFGLLTAPFMMILILLVLLDVGRPAFWKQVRAGKDGRLFTLIKLRTMNNKRDSNGKLLSNNQRITPLGRFLRATSLDELPELFNVLRGDMSLVGPRPLIVRYLNRYNPTQARRHEVKPGLTGWAQINGRNAISWENKFALDVWYVDNFSFRLDFMIILLTVSKVLKREGISASGYIGGEEFLG